MGDELASALPPTLYKYTTWSDPDRSGIFCKNQLYFASARDFNDPFDCALPVVVCGSDGELLDSARANAKERNPDLDDAEILALARQMVAQRPFEDEERMRQVNETNEKDLACKFGIFCFSAERADIRLWSHYGANHTGYCIGFDSKKLLHWSQLWSYYNDGLLTLEPVVYEVELPQPNLLQEGFLWKILTTKSHYWKDEKEYRLILCGKPGVLLTFPKNVISDVMLGLKMDPQQRRQIVECVRNHALDIRLWQAKKSEVEYALEYEQIG